MPQIYEGDRVEWVTPREATALAELGVITTCAGCDSFHHEEFERWEEIERWLVVMRGEPLVTAPAPPVLRRTGSRTRRRRAQTP